MPVSRRSFLGSVACSSCALLGARFPVGRWSLSAQRSFAYVASAGLSDQGIHVFRVEGQQWRRVQFVASSAPSSFAMSPDGQVLFVANRVSEYLGLPTGSVESYSVDARSGRLSLLSRRALSLSATHPEHLAVAPDGSHLVVAGTGGGTYNVFPIATSGLLMPFTCVRKELGSGQHPVHQACAHPSHVAFDSQHRILAADVGADTVSVLHQQDGLLSVCSRAKTQPGMGPRRLVLDRTESLVVVAGGLSRSVAVHRYDLAQGRLEPAASYLENGSASKGGWTSLLAHPRRDLVVGSWSDQTRSGVVCWRLDRRTCSLLRLAEVTERADLQSVMPLSLDDHTFLVADGLAGRVRSLSLDPEGGALAWGRYVAALPGAGAIQLRAI